MEGHGLHFATVLMANVAISNYVGVLTVPSLVVVSEEMFHFVRDPIFSSRAELLRDILMGLPEYLIRKVTIHYSRNIFIIV